MLEFQYSVDMFDEYIGLTEIELSLKLSKESKTYRVVRLNGNYLICTRDYNPNRLNISLNNSMIDYIMGWGQYSIYKYFYGYFQNKHKLVDKY